MKKMFKFIFCLVFLISLCGCGKKEELSSKELQNTLESLGFSVNDSTEIVNDDSIKKVYSAINNENGYVLEFYFFKTEEDSKIGFNNNLKLFKEYYEDKVKLKNGPNYDKAVQKTNDKYNYLFRIGKTLVFSSNNIEYKSSINSTLKKLGY